jgi:phosphatidylserine decarboxylase
MKFFVKLALWFLSFPILSRIYGRIVRLRHPRFLIRFIINLFRKTYEIEMTEYQGEPEDYRSLNEFFIRPLDPRKRTLERDEQAILSPADGRLTSVETIYSDSALQVKGITYQVSQLLGESLDYSRGWHVAVIYLSPSNYHRYHFPVSAEVTRYLHTGARLFPVNDVGLKYVPGLFVRNERVIVELQKEEHTCYAVAVGATFVGSIKMEFMPEAHIRHQWQPVNQSFNQMDEMGRFEMGSTIVMVIPKEMAQPIPETLDKPVRVGQRIFK